MNTILSNSNPAVLSVSVAVADAGSMAGFVFVIKSSPDVLRKRAKSYKSIDRERKFIRGHRAKLKKALLTFFKTQAKDIASQVVDELSKSNASLVTRILANLNLKDWETTIAKRTKPYLSAIAVDGGEQGIEALGVTSKEVIALMRERAIAWGEQRSAELVGMRWQDGELVPNPDARWVITDATRDLLRSTIQNGLDQGMSMQELAKEIEDSYAFSSARASTIARTETAMADVAGTMESYRATPGVTGKQWLTAGDELVSDACLSNEAAGTIPLDKNFPAGDDAPPNHPNCRCDIAPSFEPDME